MKLKKPADIQKEIPEIEDFQKPCFYKGAGRLRGSFVRVGDGDRQMSEYEVYSYEAFRKKIEDELRPVERAEIGELRTPALKRFKEHLARVKPNVAALDPHKIFQLLGFVSEGHPTIVGLFMFSVYPQGYFPQLGITAVSVCGTEINQVNEIGARFLDNTRIEGTIPQMLVGAVSFVSRNPYLANALEIIGQTENRYSGIPTIRNAMASAHLKEPLFESVHGVFRVTLYNTIVPASVGDNFENEILDFCTAPRSRNELAEKFGDRITIAYLMAKYVAPMVERGLLKLTIPEKPKSKNQRYVRT